MAEKRPRPSMWNSHTQSVSGNSDVQERVFESSSSSPAEALPSPAGSGLRRHMLYSMPSFVPLLDLYSIRYADLHDAERKLQIVYASASENHMRRLYELSKRARDAANDKDWNLVVSLWAEVAVPDWQTRPSADEMTVGDLRTTALTASPKSLAEQACALFVYPFVDDIDGADGRVQTADRVIRALVYALDKLQPMAGEGDAALELLGADKKARRIARYRLRADEEYVFGVHDDDAVFARQNQPTATDRIDPLVARFRFLRVLGSGAFGIAFLAETLTSTWPTMQRRLCTIKAELGRADDSEARVAYELTKAYSPRRLQNYQTNFVRLYTWSRSRSDIAAIQRPPQSLPQHQADTELAEFLAKLDTETQREWVYTAMEYADAGTLSTFARAHPDRLYRDIECFRGLLLQLVCTLAEVQQRLQFVHGDLHLGNVLLSRASVNEPRFDVLEYRVAGRTYQVHLRRCFNRIVKVSDYGRSRVSFGAFAARTPDSNKPPEYDLHLLALSLLGVLYNSAEIHGIRLGAVSASVWQFFRLCIIRNYADMHVREDAEMLHSYLGQDRETLNFSDPEFDPHQQDQRRLFYSAMSQRIRLLIRSSRVAPFGDGRGTTPLQLLTELPLFSRQPADAPVDDPRRVTVMNVFSGADYDPMLPMRERLRRCL